MKGFFNSFLKKKLDTKLLVYSFILVTLSSLSIAIYNKSNKYKRIQRYYYDNYRMLYILNEVCFFILISSLIYNSRYIVTELLTSYISGFLSHYKKI